MKTLLSFKSAKMLAICLTVLLCVSCTMESGGITEDGKNKQMVCTDTRDGEKFSFNSNNITNARIGYGADSSFDVVDDAGKKRTLTNSMELYLKCVEST